MLVSYNYLTMAIRRRKRLKISTGNDVGSGATASYMRKMRRQQANLASSVKNQEEKRLEEQLFGLDHSTQEAEGQNISYTANGGWLDSLRNEKLVQKSKDGTFTSKEGEANGLTGVTDDQVAAVRKRIIIRAELALSSSTWMNQALRAFLRQAGQARRHLMKTKPQKKKTKSLRKKTVSHQSHLMLSIRVLVEGPNPRRLYGATRQMRDSRFHCKTRIS